MSSVATVSVAAVSPGIFTMDQTTSQGAVLHANYSLVSPTNPARAGETLVIYCTGLGAVQATVLSGDPSPAATTVAQPTIRFGNQTGVVTYSGLAPGFAGLYQVNVAVPAGLAAGNQNLQITISGVSSNIATVAIAQ